MTKQFDTVVVGGGLAGCVAALGLARRGLDVALIAPEPVRRDARTTALMQPSVDLLESLDIWTAMRDSAARLSTMRIIDGTNRLFRAPTTTFQAGEIGEEAFAYNLPNADLLSVLMAEIDRTDGISVIRSPAISAASSDKSVTVTLADRTMIEANLAIAADGRKSPLRKASGIGARTWSYPQSALVTVFSHSVPHENISTEFHTEHGPFTQVPLPGNRSSLVWVMPPREADLASQLAPEQVAARIEERMQSMLGAVRMEEPVRCFPLSGLIAHRFGTGRILLVGEAAHVFPPIGAQGLNLGLRDVAALSKLVDNRKNDFGGIAAAYDRARRADVVSRTIAVDLLNRSLLSSFMPVALLRSSGLAILDGIGPLRGAAMHEGMTPGGSMRAAARRLDGRLRDMRDRLRGAGQTN